MNSRSRRARKSRARASSGQLAKRAANPQKPAEGGRPSIDGHDGQLAYTQQLLEVSESWSAPLPPPRYLKEYDEVCPGAAAKIIDAFEAQGAHRRELESTIVHGSERRANRGQILGFVIALIFLAASVWVILAGYPVPGLILGGADLVALVTVFVIGRRTENGD